MLCPPELITEVTDMKIATILQQEGFRGIFLPLISNFLPN